MATEECSKNKNGGCPEQDFFTYVAMQLTILLEKASTDQFWSFSVFWIFSNLMGDQRIPLEGCILGNPQFLEPAEPEPDEPTIVTEPLEP